MTRIKSIDTIRCVSIFFVIIIHTAPLHNSSPMGEDLDIALALNQLARFAVPFFFIISGYLWAQKVRRTNQIYVPTVAMAKRITFLTVAWSAIYLLPWNIYKAFTYGPLGPIKTVYWNIYAGFSQPLTTLMQGTKEHLWFLVSMLFNVVIAGVFVRLRLIYPLIFVALMLYIIGLAGGAYQHTPIGFDSEFNFRNGPFFSLAFFVTGYLLEKIPATSSYFGIGIVTTAVGAALHFSELLALKSYWHANMAQDYVASTYLFGLGAALIALSNDKRLTHSVCSSPGPLVLGIYASHFIFVDLFRPLDELLLGNKIWGVLQPLLVFFLSYTLAWKMSHFSITKKLAL